MSLVVATEPTSLVAVEDQCARIEAWAETCDNVAELRDAMNKCSAISEYLRLTATEGTARVETAKRRLEVRVGALLGPAQVGGDRSEQVDRDQPDIDKATVSHFRAMAADPDTVEEVIAASTDTNMIWSGKLDNGTLAGYTARASNQVSAALGGGSEHGLIFGNWSDALIGMWGALELVVDPYALKKQGMIEVTSFQLCDIALRHPQSFCKATGATIA